MNAGKQEDSRTIDRSVLLEWAYRHLCGMAQWAEMYSFERAHEYQQKAEAIIEVLEVADCGSVGGFDRDNKLKQSDGNSKLWRRFKAVARKHGHDSEFEDLDFFK